MEYFASNEMKVLTQPWITASLGRGLASLRDFNRLVKARTLDVSQRTRFVASLYAFNRDAASGIVALAARLTDALRGHDPTAAHRIAAGVLASAVDEYGLQGTKTHTELFFDFAKALGVDRQAACNPAHAAPAAHHLGQFVSQAYRFRSVAEGLGVHLASETTSQVEFAEWSELFVGIREYGLPTDGPGADYLLVHVDLEPAHAQGALKSAQAFLSFQPDAEDELCLAVERYAADYSRMFDELTEFLWGPELLGELSATGECACAGQQ